MQRLDGLYGLPWKINKRTCGVTKPQFQNFISFEPRMLSVIIFYEFSLTILTVGVHFYAFSSFEISLLLQNIKICCVYLYGSLHRQTLEMLKPYLSESR
jgi:hypothetical protein